MNRCTTALAASLVGALAFASPSGAQDASPKGEGQGVAEVESGTEANADPKGQLQVVRPGQTWTGTLRPGQDTDCFTLVVERPTVVTLRWKRGEPSRYVRGLLSVGKRAVSPALTILNRPTSFLKHVLPAGRHLVSVKAKVAPGPPLPYQVSFVVDSLAPNSEREPNDKPEQATPLPLGTVMRGWRSHPSADADRFEFTVAKPGIHELAIDSRPPSDGRSKAPTYVLSLSPRKGKTLYTYRLDLESRGRYYPVLDPGTYDLRVVSTRGETGDPYELSLNPFTPAIDAELVAKARQAIDRGVSWLIDADAKKAGTRLKVVDASCGLLALAEGSGSQERAAERKAAVLALIELLKGELAPVKGVLWHGEQVQAFRHATHYEVAFAALALAEAVAGGYAEAREPCQEVVRFLLATQLSQERPAPYGGPVPKTSKHAGGWRYGAKSKDSDLSVTGWCVVGLFAADAAKVSVRGLVPGVRKALRYVQICKGKKGFAYQPQKAHETSILHGVGSLLYLLFDLEGPPLKKGLSHLDRHLCAGTQTGIGHNAPFYYWYYATRTHFLRGGKPWKAWRAVALRQLTRRQTPGGSWDPLHAEAAGGRRYSTALAVLILRLCLNEAPAYLAKELEAF